MLLVQDHEPLFRHTRTCMHTHTHTHTHTLTPPHLTSPSPPLPSPPTEPPSQPAHTCTLVHACMLTPPHTHPEHLLTLTPSPSPGFLSAPPGSTPCEYLLTPPPLCVSQRPEFPASAPREYVVLAQLCWHPTADMR